MLENLLQPAAGMLRDGAAADANGNRGECCDANQKTRFHVQTFLQFAWAGFSLRRLNEL